MKRLLKYLLIAVLFTGCGLAKEYEVVRQSQEPGPYETFLLQHPKSKYADDARARLYAAQQIADYKLAKEEQSIGLYEAFVQTYPESKLTPLAKEELYVLLEVRDWQKATNTDKVYEYQRYLDNYPLTTHLTEAQARIAALGVTREYDQAVASDTEAALRSFADRFPTDGRVPAAKARIARLQEGTDWLRAKQLNTSAAYREFYISYPEAPEAEKARSEDQRMAEEESFNASTRTGSLADYKSYLARYPNGRYAARVRTQVEELEVHGPAWRRTESLNTIEGYNAFAYQHAGSEKSGEARSRAASMQREEERRLADAERERVARVAQAEADRERRDAEAAEARRLKKIRDELDLFERAERNESKRDYERYVRTYPNGRYRAEAEKAIIDLEVAKIFRGDYGKLPPMQRSGYGSSYSSTTSISVQNDTKYTLTVRYSGPTSKKVEIPRGGSRDFTLSSGAYRITASVNARNVQNYAGSESLSGGEYSSKFYIETTTGYGRY
jgi:outer membrane protein assembly factor BamD (BamD/ComL family)